MDTGFTGTLSIPAHVIQSLGLLRYSIRLSTFADGGTGVTRTFWGEVDWIEGSVSIEVLEGSVPEAMIGAGMLGGHVLLVDYTDPGVVEIR